MTERGPDEIEREIEDERAALAATLDRLQDSVSPDALVAKAGTRLKTDGEALAQRVAERIAAQPVAAAVAAAGMAWVLFGPDTQGRRQSRGSKGEAAGKGSFERERQHAARWLMSHDPDPWQSLRKARGGVSPRVAHMIDRLDGGIADLPRAAKAEIRQSRLRAISARMVTERRAAR